MSSSSSSIIYKNDPHYTTIAEYSSCDISDALVKQGVDHGGLIPHLTQRSGPATTAVGKAYTALYAPLDDPRPKIASGYIDTAPEGSIIVIATAPEVQLIHAPYTRITNALYGGLMSTRAQYLKCNGSVIFGSIRDLAEHRALNYPVFSYSHGTTAPFRAVKLVAVNEPIQIKVASQLGNPTVEYDLRTINPGDYVVSDENGTVIIPADDPNYVNQVINRLKPATEADQLVAQDIKNGVPAAEAQKNRRGGL